MAFYKISKYILFASSIPSMILSHILTKITSDKSCLTFDNIEEV